MKPYFQAFNVWPI